MMVELPREAIEKGNWQQITNRIHTFRDHPGLLCWGSEERVARGRPERSMVLTGLRGVGKTVLLNTFRSMALQRLWGTGKIEARPDQSIRRPIAAALHMAVRELAPRHRAPDRIDYFLGVLKSFALRDPKAPKGATVTSQFGIDVPAVRGRADRPRMNTTAARAPTTPNRARTRLSPRGRDPSVPGGLGQT